MKGLSWSHLGTGVAIIALGVVLSGTLDRIATDKKVREEAREMAPLLSPEREEDSKQVKDSKEERDAGGEKEPR